MKDSLGLWCAFWCCRVPAKVLHDSLPWLVHVADELNDKGANSDGQEDTDRQMHRQTDRHRHQDRQSDAHMSSQSSHSRKGALPGHKGLLHHTALFLDLLQGLFSRCCSA